MKKKGRVDQLVCMEGGGEEETVQPPKWNQEFVFMSEYVLEKTRKWMNGEGERIRKGIIKRIAKYILSHSNRF